MTKCWMPDTLLPLELKLKKQEYLFRKKDFLMTQHGYLFKE